MTLNRVEQTDIKWSSRVTCPNRPVASRLAYSAFLIECIDTASVMVSTKPELAPVIKMRKLEEFSAAKRRNTISYYLTQQAHFSSAQMPTNSRMSCTASCSCRRSPPVLTMTETQSQLALKAECAFRREDQCRLIVVHTKVAVW